MIKPYDSDGLFGHYKFIDKRHDQGVPRENATRIIRLNHSGSVAHFPTILYLFTSINFLLPMIRYIFFVYALYTLILFRVCSRMVKYRQQSRPAGYAATSNDNNDRTITTTTTTAAVATAGTSTTIIIYYYYYFLYYHY